MNPSEATQSASPQQKERANLSVLNYFWALSDLVGLFLTKLGPAPGQHQEPSRLATLQNACLADTLCRTGPTHDTPMGCVYRIQSKLAHSRKAYDPIEVHRANDSICIKDCIVSLQDMRRMASTITTTRVEEALRSCLFLPSTATIQPPGLKFCHRTLTCPGLFDQTRAHHILVKDPNQERGPNWNGHSPDQKVEKSEDSRLWTLVLFVYSTRH